VHEANSATLASSGGVVQELCITPKGVAFLVPTLMPTGPPIIHNRRPHKQFGLEARVGIDRNTPVFMAFLAYPAALLKLTLPQLDLTRTYSFGVRFGVRLVLGTTK